jgi:hypothetical protein
VRGCLPLALGTLAPADAQALDEDAGRFTGGATKEQVTMLTGNPEPEYGEGVCPACGVLGVETGADTFIVGDDPYQELHDEVADRVSDPNDALVKENAQATIALWVAKDGEN